MCENIFDVQRSELFEVLERLRHAFWSDQVSPPPEPIIPPSQVELPNLKRPRSEPDQDVTYQQQQPQESPSPTPKKRVRLEQHTPGT